MANRVWLMILFAVFVPEIYLGAEVDPAALEQAIGVSTWISWVVNLLIVQLSRHGLATRATRVRRQRVPDGAT